MARGNREESLPKSPEKSLQGNIPLPGNKLSSYPTMPIRGASHGSVNDNRPGGKPDHQSRLPLGSEQTPTATERGPDSPTRPPGQGGPLDFFSFAECMRNPCETMAEAFETVPTSDEPRYVTRTFHWRPEDFPIEDGTYMQCDEPWESDLPPHRTGERAGVAFKAGKIGQPFKVMQHVADPVDDIFDDDCEVDATEEAPTHSGLACAFTSSALIDLEVSNSNSEARNGGLADIAVVTQLAGSPSGLHDSMQAASTTPEWCADWSDFAPVAADNSSALMQEPTLVDMPASTVYSTNLVDVLAASFPSGPAEVMPAVAAPAFMPSPVNHIGVAAAALGEGTVNHIGVAGAPLGADEVTRLREQLRALQIENEALKGSSPIPPQDDNSLSKPGFIV